MFLTLKFVHCLFTGCKGCCSEKKSCCGKDQNKTLLDRIGGPAALSKCVDIFYDTMLADKRVNHYFKNTNMKHQRQQQKDFLQTVLGNQTTDAVYKGKNMLDAHKGLKVTNEAYDATVENLVGALVKCGVSQQIINEIAPTVESLRGDIVEVQSKTLLERIGGPQALSTCVDIFYDKMLADKRVNHYFKNTNMTHQRQQQKDFLQTVLGNQTTDAVYKGKNMLDAHKGLKVTDEAYNATVENLVGALVKCGVSQQIIGEIAPTVESLRADIVEVKSQTLLDRIGGPKALSVAIDLFYDIMLADSRVNHYFKNTDMIHQRQQQKNFLQTVLGNQTSDAVYQGKNMLDAHKGLHVTNEAFDATIENLVTALTKSGVDQQTLSEIAPIALSLRGDIVLQ